MGTKPRSREFGIELGIMKPGKKNSITDVEGVGVGHSTIIRGDDVRTGVTAIVPHKDNLYEQKVTAAVDLFNAYGKSTGLPQINACAEGANPAYASRPRSRTGVKTG